MTRSSVLLVIALLGAASACGNTAQSSRTSGSAFSSPTAPRSITVHGAVNVSYGNASDDITCALRVESANPVSVAFTDASGVARDAPCEPGGGIDADRWSVLGLRQVPAERSGAGSLSDLYQVEVSGKAAGSVSLTDLQASDLTFDIHV